LRMPPSLLRLATAEQGEEDRGGARRCVSSTNAYHPGACVGRHAHHGDVVERGPCPSHALAVGRPATTPRHVGETDRQPERYRVAGQARTSFPSMVSETNHSPQAASARSSITRVRPMGRVPESRGCVAVNGTRAGSVPFRAPRSTSR
jgi:hypothetical protein